jgi:peptidoglycan/xylan/chitin deacetylase (PgdA/CDA1 family)
MTGTFALTFDTELIWGSFDKYTPTEFAKRYPDVRRVIAQILQLLERHEVPATWAVVGHLYLRECARDVRGRAHPELASPRQRWRRGDWYEADPSTDLNRDPLWYGPDLLDAIQSSRITHEIGCHSFSHLLYGDPDLTRGAVDADLDACIRLAAERGISLRSFVFPRNVEGHHEALLAHGFVAYRGRDPLWQARLPGALERAGHLADQLLGLPPPVSTPSEKLPGLWNVPGSALLIHRDGPRRAITMAARLRKVRSGIERAATSGQTFHLWTHPFNLAGDPRYMLETLDRTLHLVVQARDRGELATATMAEIATRAAASRLA